MPAFDKLATTTRNAMSSSPNSAISDSSSSRTVIGTWVKNTSSGSITSPHVVVVEARRETKTPKFPLLSRQSRSCPGCELQKNPYALEAYPMFRDTCPVFPHDEYKQGMEAFSDEEPPTLARMLFMYGFLFFPFWLAGIYIICTPLLPTPDWEAGKTEEEKAKLLRLLRKTELKWAKRDGFCALVSLDRLCKNTLPSTMPLRVLSAGSNAHGQLANQSFDDSHVLQPCGFAPDNMSVIEHQVPGDRVIRIACGANHTLLLLELEHPSGPGHGPVRQLWGCGDNRKGQLGPRQFQKELENCRSSVFRRLDPSILDAAGIDEENHAIHTIAASWESTFIVLRQKHEAARNSKDAIIALGSNDYGDLGVGLSPKELNYSPEPRRVALEETFETHYPTAPSGFQITELIAGPHHAVATLQLFFQNREEKVVVGWGANRHGQLDMDFQPQSHSKQPKPSVSHFMPRPVVLRMSHKYPDGMPDSIITFALGSQHTVLLHRSGHVTALGSNRKGQLAGLRDKSMIIDVQCTWNGTYYIQGDGVLGSQQGLGCSQWEIQAAGSCDKGQLGHSPVTPSMTFDSGVVQFPFRSIAHRLMDVACGSEHVLALFTRDDTQSSTGGSTELWGWGWNEHGNLGLGHTADVHLPLLIWPMPGDDQVDRRVLAVWAGCGTSWIAETYEKPISA